MSTQHVQGWASCGNSVKFLQLFFVSCCCCVGSVATHLDDLYERGLLSKEELEGAKASHHGGANVGAAVTGLVSGLIEENNQRILAQVATMIRGGAEGEGTPSAASGLSKRQLQAASGATAANLVSAGVWIKGDGAKLCFGTDAAASLYAHPIAGGGALATDGGLRVGAVDDGACTDDALGLIRFQDGEFSGCVAAGLWAKMSFVPTAAPTSAPTGSPTEMEYSDNLAKDLPNSAFTCDSYVTGDHPHYAKSDDNSVWRHTSNSHWVQIDLGAGNAQPVIKVELKTISEGAYMPLAYTIQYAPNLDHGWSNAVVVSGAPNSEARIEEFDNVGAYRYWRLYVTNCDGDCRIAYFALYKNKHE